MMPINSFVVYTISITCSYIMLYLVLSAYPTQTSKYCIYARQCAQMSLWVLSSYCVLESQTRRRTGLYWCPVRCQKCSCTTHPSLLFKVRPLKIRGYYPERGTCQKIGRAFRYAQLEYRCHSRWLIPSTGGTVLAYTIPDMYGVSTYTSLDAVSLFLGFPLECRISALPKIYLIALV